MSIQNQELHTYMSVFNTKINKTDISDITFTTSDDVKPFWGCATTCIALVFERLENTVYRLKAMRKHYQPLKRKLWVVKIMTFYRSDIIKNQKDIRRKGRVSNNPGVDLPHLNNP